MELPILPLHTLDPPRSERECFKKSWINSGFLIFLHLLKVLRKTDCLGQRNPDTFHGKHQWCVYRGFFITSAVETETSSLETHTMHVMLSCNVGRVDLQQAGGVVPLLRRFHLLTAGMPSDRLVMVMLDC